VKIKSITIQNVEKKKKKITYHNQRGQLCLEVGHKIGY